MQEHSNITENKSARFLIVLFIRGITNGSIFSFLINLIKTKGWYSEKGNNALELKSVDVDAVRKSIALNQYQKSTQNPYANQEVIKINKDFTQSETAKILGISQVKVSRYEKKSLNKMYNYLNI